VESAEPLQKFGADAFRQWAAGGGSTGYDIPFRWTEVEHGKKFLTKLWNVARFILASLPASPPKPDYGKLTLIDKWLLSSLQKLVQDVTEALDSFQFNLALEAIRDFTWHSLADNYFEAVKYRLQPGADKASQEAVQHCLHESLSTICKLIAPICPHISESIYQQISTKTKAQSVHKAKWPEANSELLREEWVKDGQIVIDTIASGRRKKAEKRLALKAPLKALVVQGPRQSLKLLRESQESILQTLKAEVLKLEEISESSASGQPSGVVRVEVVA
jgi:valyl-tRNA synthetase